MLDESSKLICISGFSGSGKTEFLSCLSKKGCNTFSVDEYVHSIYKKNNIGYEIIKNNFGVEFVNDQEVDRPKLRDLILNDNDQKLLLEKLMNKIIFNKLSELKFKNELIFVELGTYIFFENFFSSLFQKVIIIDSNGKSYKKNIFKKFSNIEKFSTKLVGNSKNPEKSNVFYSDFVVKNDGNLMDLEASATEIIKFFKPV